MNKTININLAGFSFTIEEKAYDALHLYLQAIKSFLSSEEDMEEIVSDIESRIAELLQERLKEGREVVEQADIDHVMTVLGDPEYFKSDSDEPNEAYQEKSKRKRGTKLYRNPDDKQVGGVCGGLGAYFSIDPLIFRLAFVLSVITIGIGLVPYLILWAVVPEAKTTAEKLEMEGEEVNVENLKKRFRKESENVKESFKNFKNGVKGNSSSANHLSNGLKEIVNFFATFLRLVWSVVRKIVGVVFVIIASLLIVGCVTMLCSTFFGFDTAIFGELGKLPSDEIADIFFRSKSDYNFLVFILLFFFGTLITGFYLAGFKALGFKLPGKAIFGISIPIILTICLFSFFSLLDDNAFSFEETGQITERVILEDLGSDTLSIHANEDIYFSPDFLGHHNEGIKLLTLEKEDLISGVVIVDVEESADSTWFVEVRKIARGRTTKEARKTAEAINYNFTQNASSLWFDPTFNWDKSLKYRRQKVYITVHVPVGKTIYLADGTDRIIYDIENLQNMYDGNMIGKYWLMSEKGLTISK